MTHKHPDPEPGVYQVPHEKMPDIRPEDYVDYLIWSGMASNSDTYGGEILFFCGERVPIGKALRRYSQYQTTYGHRKATDLFWVFHSVLNYPERKLRPDWSRSYQRLTPEEIEEVLKERNPRIHPDMQEMLREYLETGVARSKYPVI